MPKKDAKEQKSVAEIADILAAQIESGQFSPNSRLLPALDLAKQYGTSRDTVNRAFRQLQGEGLLESRGTDTRGVIISGPKIHLSGLTARFDIELEKKGLKPFEKNADEPATVPAPPWVAQALGIQAGTPVARRFRVQGIEQGTRQIPMRLAENYYSTALVDQEILGKMQKDDRFDSLLAIKEKHGKFIAHTHEELAMRFARARERELLEITPQHPIIELRRINTAEDGTVVMVNKIIVVASFFIIDSDYSVSLWK